MMTYGAAAPLLGLAMLVALFFRSLRVHQLLCTFVSSPAEASIGGVADLVSDCRDFHSQQHPLLASRWFLAIFS